MTDVFVTAVAAETTFVPESPCALDEATFLRDGQYFTTTVYAATL